MRGIDGGHDATTAPARRWALIAVLAMVAVMVIAPPASQATTATPLDELGWHLVAHMSGSGGMFDGDTQLAPGASHGTFVEDPTATTPDFQRAYSSDVDEILFITGDDTVWGVTNYALLRTLIDARADGRYDQNLDFSTNAGLVTGNVLSRSNTSNPEDPWISIANGNHFDGIAEGLIVWGEDNWPDNGTSPGHVQLKNNHGGVNVYVRGGAAPVVTEGTLAPAPVGAVTATATFTDASAVDTHSCTMNFGDGPEDGTVDGTTCSAEHTFGTPGVYDVAVTVTDGAGNSDSGTVTVVVYDPDAGFVTGGGWIDSPAEALTADGQASGKASFGFVSRYKKGANVPTGTTQFQFRAGDLSFHSTSYDWLVVGGDGRAQFKGTGELNGVSGHDFMLTAVDGAQDKFRIKITAPGGGVVYDNNTETALGGGSIIIHRR